MSWGQMTGMPENCPKASFASVSFVFGVVVTTSTCARDEVLNASQAVPSRDAGGSARDVVGVRQRRAATAVEMSNADLLMNQTAWRVTGDAESSRARGALTVIMLSIGAVALMPILHCLIISHLYFSSRTSS